MTDTEYKQLVVSLTEEIWSRLQPSRDQPSRDRQGAEICSCSTADISELVHSGACRIAVHPPSPPVDPETAALIDHTLLRPDATRDEIVKVCDEAIQFSFASVCVNPTWVALVAERLRCHPARVCTVCGFPLGATLPAVKRAEAAEAVKLGAQEVDMVINVGALRSGDWDLVRLDIRGVVEVCHAAGVLTKVILETALLNDEEKVAACLLARSAGADFVKTSTGFSSGGATPHDVELMRYVVGEQLGVKASGGVRTLADVKKMVAAGASRIGASASVKIMEETKGVGGRATP